MAIRMRACRFIRAGSFSRRSSRAVRRFAWCRIQARGTSRQNGSSAATIGGTAAGAGNVISGNGDHGMVVATTGNTIQGNIVGLNAAGSASVTNGNDGIEVSASSNIIGGSTAGARNIISGNNNVPNTSKGIWIHGGAGTVVQGNYIGADISGTSACPNYGGGISINGSNNNTIGGTSAGQGNTIAYNSNSGVIISSSTGNAIEGNSIFGNTNLGIDLGGDGVTVNNGTKAAGSPNFGMNYPVFDLATLNGTTLSVVGYVGSAATQSTFASARVELFKASPDASGYGEGQSYLGFLTTNASGNLVGSITVSGLAVGDKITATATDASGNTSEFGPNFTVTVPRTPFDYAAFCNSSLSSSKLATGSAGANGDIYCNGNLILNGSSAVNGDAVASGTTTASSITGVLGAPFPAAAMSAIDIAHYTSIADTYYASGQTFSGTTWNFGANYGVIVVNGDVSITGALNFTGSAILAVNGKITITGDIIAGSGSSKIVLMANNGITVSGGATLNCWLYAHNAGNTADISVGASSTITGGIAGDTMSVTSSGATSIHDSAMNAALGHSLHLPGY